MLVPFIAHFWGFLGGYLHAGVAIFPYFFGEAPLQKHFENLPDKRMTTQWHSAYLEGFGRPELLWNVLRSRLGLPLGLLGLYNILDGKVQ
jgi:hypothetical protein